MIQIGKCKEINGTMMYSAGYEDGLVYKDEDAFLHHPDRVCYIPEGEFESCRGDKELVAIVDGKEYVAAKGYTRNQLAAMAEDTYDEDGDEIPPERLFYHCTWQYPETYLDEISTGSKEDKIKNAGNWLDLDKCEKAYSIGGIKTTWMDYTYDWYNNLPDEEKYDCENYWDDEKYYADFKAWWDSLPFAEQERIYNML